jgi:predicted dehydrogenase
MELLSEGEDVRQYVSISTLLKHEHEIDVVVIATPNRLHAQQSIESLKHGKHVLCEKPMAIRSADDKGSQEFRKTLGDSQAEPIQSADSAA